MIAENDVIFYLLIVWAATVTILLIIMKQKHIKYIDELRKDQKLQAEQTGAKEKRQAEQTDAKEKRQAEQTDAKEVSEKLRELQKMSFLL